MKLTSSALYVFYIYVLLGTEFYYIKLFGGSLRPYHFLTPIVIISLYKYFPRVIKSSIFIAFFVFFSVNFISASLSVDPLDTLRRVGFLFSNFLISIAICLLLVSEKLNLDKIIIICTNMAVIGVIFGIAQISLFKISGFNLGFSESQQLQIANGFASGFFTEANTFSKYLSAIFLLILPRILWKKNDKNFNNYLIISIILIGLLLSFTRSAIIGLTITLLIIFFWYLAYERRSIFASRLTLVLSVGFIFFSIYSSVVGVFNEYALHKITNFFDSEEILYGGSSSLRLSAQQVLWESFLIDEKTVILGNGWGDVKIDVGDETVQAFGAEIIQMLASGGLLLGMAYFLYQITVIRTLLKVRKIHLSKLIQIDGVFFAVVGLLVLGQISSLMLLPIYWMIFGFAIYFSYIRKKSLRAHR